MHKVGKCWTALILALAALGLLRTSAGAQDSQKDPPTLSSQILKLEREGRYVEAIPLAERSVEQAGQIYGQDSLEFASALSRLARLQHWQGRYADAAMSNRRVIEIREKELGAEHWSTAIGLNDLAEVYRAQGLFGDALPLYQRAIRILEKKDDAQSLGVVLHNLGGLYWAQSRYTDAEPHLQRSLSVLESAPEKDEDKIATAVLALGTLYSSMGRFSDAEPLLKHAISMWEKQRGADNVIVSNAIHALADLYVKQQRYAEAEPLAVRALAMAEQVLGADHPEVAKSMAQVGLINQYLGRLVEAEQLQLRVVQTFEKTLGPSHPAVGVAVNNLAELYRAQARYADAERGYVKALAIAEAAFGPEHLDVGSALNNLGDLYASQARFGEAEPHLLRAVTIFEKALGADHDMVGSAWGNLAVMELRRSHWQRAAEYLKRSTDLFKRRARLGLPTTLQVSNQSRAIDHSYFAALVRTTYRYALEQREANAIHASEMFEAAQWSSASRAAASLALMASRSAMGDARLNEVVRERQDLLSEWQRLDGERNTYLSRAAKDRDNHAVATTAARIAEIESRIKNTDQGLAISFPDYFALSRADPLSVVDVQAQLADREALVLFLDNSNSAAGLKLGGETFIWILTKTAVRWYRSSLGTEALAQEVGILRCGLDSTMWDEQAAGCHAHTKRTPLRDETGAIRTETLPFDTARAHALYKSLFGPAEDLIRGKELLIVPSGPLTQLPFHVLVTSLPDAASAGLIRREVTVIGVQFAGNKESQLPTLQGVPVQPIAGGAAEAAGVQPGDTLLSVGSMDVGSAQQATDAIRMYRPGGNINLRLLRGSEEKSITVATQAKMVEEWVPRLFDHASTGDIRWFARDYVHSVLPAAASLKALRRIAKPSSGGKALMGVGNPLLDGDPAQRPLEADWAKLSRQKQSCSPASAQRVAGHGKASRGVARMVTRSGRADLDHLLLQSPLHETADELCAVAKELKVSSSNILLGAKATEATIKRMSKEGQLANYRILHFATHGAVAGEISGTTEAGLILTPPKEQSDDDDGYLTASEVAGLKLDADWVILSACNTAAGSTQDAEALSGLARAFFYAGARALLVSHWAVDSAATVNLITRAVRTINADKRLGRAQALQRAMLAMVDGGATWQRHPAFWAPFVVVGEGASSR